MTTTEENKKAKNYETFKEVAESNLQMFVNGFKDSVFNYRALNTNKICNLSDSEVRQLAVNFFIKEMAKKVSEKTDLYFEQKPTLK